MTDTPETPQPLAGEFVAREVYDRLLAEPDKGPIATSIAEENLTGEDEQPADVDAAAKETAEPETEPEAKPETAAVAEPAAVDRFTETLAKVDATLQKLDAKMEERAEAETPVVDEIPADIKLLLESDDPRDQALGRQMQETRKENAELRARMDASDKAAHDEAMQRAGEAAAVYIDAVSKKCDPPLTEPEKDAVVEMLTDESRGTPLAKTLTFDKGVHVMFPGRLKVQAPAQPAPSNNGAETPNGSGKRPAAPGRATATDLIVGGGAAGPTTAQVRKPPANETLEQALARGSKAVGLTR